MLNKLIEDLLGILSTLFLLREETLSTASWHRPYIVEWDVGIDILSTRYLPFLSL